MNYSERAVALSSALEADGYHLAIDEVGSRVSAIITAGPDACEECLVPKELFRGMLSHEIARPRHAHLVTVAEVHRPNHLIRQLRLIPRIERTQAA